MKELSIEQKAKTYDEALERAKMSYHTGDYDKDTLEMLEIIFPELKESEDEKIRKAIKKALQVRCDGSRIISDEPVILEEAIAWLEKQKTSEEAIQYLKENHSPSEVSDFQTAMNIAVAKAYDKGVKDGLEKQGEQKPTDKVEPKFKNGQWIVWKEKCYKINYNGCGYELVDQDGLSTSLEYGTIDENAHLWDVTTDAKDGDVLHSPNHRLIWIYKDIQYYHVCVNMNYVKENFSTDGFIVIPTDVCPATKDEQTILSVRIKESGYEWDAEKKEVKKIEQKPTDEEMKTLLRTEYEKGRADAITEMQKPVDCTDCTNSKGCINCEDGNMKETLVQKTAWSEEDENILDAITYTVKNSGYKHCIGVSNEMMITFIKSLKGRVQPKQEWSEEDESYLNTTIAYLKDAKEFKKSAENCINWLKSLRPQNRWKPSDKQLKALKNAIHLNPFENPSDSILWGLYEQLKKLK